VNPLLLSLSLVCTNGVAHIRVSVPAAGIAVLQRSEDGKWWREVSRPVVCAGGCEAGWAERVSGGCALYRVEWRGVVVKP